MTEIEEVRQKIILASEDFGKRALAYFNSLGLRNIHSVPNNFGTPFPGIRGSRALDDVLKTEGFSQVDYEVALEWPGYCANPIFGISLGGSNRTSSTSIRGYIRCGREIYMPNGHEIKHIRDARLQNFLLTELISTYGALFPLNGK